MNKPEVRRLLGYISAGFDNRALSDATAEVWSEELPDIPFDVAKEAVRRHFRKPAPRQYLSLDVLMDEIRVLTRQTSTAIEEDVRSAKARGFLDASWPARKPLPAPVAARLTEARQAFARQAAAIESAVIENPRSLSELGTLGKEMPRG
ncbi:hypothetical protein NYQ35_15960 [Curtobacterium flaccumfaciens pv. flaccumfaciens]|uniref:hypothetical protein n=1 Tax=Curtobacterium flaccumfaciens TaxID=2035 RepID=UPI00217DA4A4|nr:hypothetical protein [Curtobacterium flaccumfaciens]MCS6570301.1 hypothetical protein [Curtobacterium flaccumfaciens pv. flaccumfaciens]MCS6585157.1 hypothetical protein [Curtobacterium flaccumfaciens pv. flaccumfaciens]